LRAATTDAHRRAERTGIMTRLFSGHIEHREYAALLSNLRALYEGLEAGLATNAAHPAIAPILFSELPRLAALDADLAVWDPTAASRALVPTAAAYRERLLMLAIDDPSGLVAHAYVRYLGDLSGGQMLGRRMDERLGLNGRGIAFYQFPIDDVRTFKARYRAALDGLPLGETAQSGLVKEAIHAFAMHEQMFIELG
jgi:heme oxygenase (biliverdin-producing, ferredoxin)